MENLPQDIENQIKEADFLINDRRPSEAILIIKQVIKDLPEEPYFYYLLGIARMKCARFFLAKRALEKAREIDPKNPENLRSLGWVKVMIGELEEGRKDLRESISLDLINPLAYVDLAMSYIDYFEFKEASEWFARAKALSPKDFFVLEQCRKAEEIKKDVAKYSESELEKAKQEKLNPKNAKNFRLAMLQTFINKSNRKNFAEDEIEEMNEELEMNGVLPQVVTINDENNPDEKAMIEYIEWHNKVEDVERKISAEEEKEISRKLFSSKTPSAEIKTCILRLAHQGTESALNLLEKFKRGDSLELKVWIKMAIEECRFFLKNQK